MDDTQVEDAMRELSPEHRALIELSVIRGISDDEIGGYLGIDPERIAERRGAALHTVASRCGDGSDEGVRRVVAALGGDQEQAAADVEKAHQTGEIDALEELEPVDAEPIVRPDIPLEPAPPGIVDAIVVEDEPGPARRRPLVPLLLGGAVVVAVVVVLIVVLGGSDGDDPGGDRTVAARPGATLEPLVPGGSARGSALILDGGGAPRLRLSVRNLPPPQSGGYVAWLYDSVTDTRALSGALRGTFTVTATLPGDYRRYRFVDVSREPADGNRNHSGQSVLRVPLRRIPGFGD